LPTSRRAAPRIARRYITHFASRVNNAASYFIGVKPVMAPRIVRENMC